MNSFTEKEIKKLQQNLSAIRKIAGWSSEELGELIGVTKQTVSNIETGKSKMSKTQYIAIRSVIDYEISENPDNKLLPQVIEILLNSDDTPENKQKALATKEFIDRTTKAAITSGALVGVTGLISAFSAPIATALIAPAAINGSEWLKKILKK